MAGHYFRPHRNYLADSCFCKNSRFRPRSSNVMFSVFHKFKSFSLKFSFNVACSVIFSQYPNLHNSYVNCFIDNFNYCTAFYAIIIFIVIGKKNSQTSVSDADREIPTLGSMSNAGNSVNLVSGIICYPRVGISKSASETDV